MSCRKKRLIDHWRRFRGGPDFSRNEVIDVKLENYLFSLTLPLSNISSVEPPREVNFPFSQDGWFERHAVNRQQHHLVHIYTSLWMYLPIGLLARQNELGVLSCSAWIKKIPNAKVVNAENLNEIGSYLIEEYDTHYNSPVIGDNYLGFNTKVCQQKREELNKYAPDMSKARLNESIKCALEASGFPCLAPYEIRMVNGNNWVFYLEHQTRSYTNDRYYCLPLKGEYYLIIRFRYRVDLAQKFKLWKKHAEAAEKRIMESVKIESVEPLQIESQK